MGQRKNDSSLDIEAVVMALREQLMEYFKGGCVQSMVSRGSIQLTYMRDYAPPRYNYERLEDNIAQQAVLRLGPVPILGLQHSPDQATLYTSVLRRSPQLRQVEEQLRDFFGQYLSGVEVNEQEGRVIYGPR